MDTADFMPDESFARQLDGTDPLAHFRDRFFIPQLRNGRDVVYLAGNSLGLQPRTVPELINQELRDWAELGVDAHFKDRNAWYSYHEQFRESGARLVGAVPGEVVMMNSLTVNLHLMMVSFYRPSRQRYKIVMEHAAFPSDTYAVKTQLRYHGIDPADGLVVLKPRPGSETLHTQDIEQTLSEQGEQIALVLLGGINFFTGQLFDMQRITAAAKARGCVVGFDLAHAAGNVPLALHDWGVDFAVWCTYKYLNCGSGAVAGCFVHETHGRNIDLVRFAGWWGNDPATRFRLHLQQDFIPRVGADGWQISNPPILSMVPLAASFAVFEEATLPALRRKSERLTAYLEYLIDRMQTDIVTVITPRDPQARGCQLSLRVQDRPRDWFKALRAKGLVCDFRDPDVIRVAPAPLFNTFHDVWVFADVLAREIK